MDGPRLEREGHTPSLWDWLDYVIQQAGKFPGEEVQWCPDSAYNAALEHCFRSEWLTPYMTRAEIAKWKAEHLDRWSGFLVSVRDPTNLRVKIREMRRMRWSDPEAGNNYCLKLLPGGSYRAAALRAKCRQPQATVLPETQHSRRGKPELAEAASAVQTEEDSKELSLSEQTLPSVPWSLVRILKEHPEGLRGNADSLKRSKLCPADILYKAKASRQPWARLFIRSILKRRVGRVVYYSVARSLHPLSQ